MTELARVAVVLAAGSGTRVGHSLPKQLIEVGGLTILERTVRAFERSALIDEVVVMAPASHRREIDDVLTTAGLDKLSGIHDGGVTRSDSSRRALAAIGGRECHVLLHDGARPLVSDTLIARCAARLADFDAVAPVVGVADTVVEIDAETSTVRRAPPRPSLARVQTPQAFRLSVIAEAYDRAAADADFWATDDCGVVLTYLPAVAVGYVDGEERNFKVTNSDDLDLLARYLARDAAPPPSL